MLKTIGVWVACLLFVSSAHAFSNSNMQNTMSGVIQSKMQSRGIQPVYPSYSSSLLLIGQAFASAAAGALTVTAAGVTAPAWLTAGVAAGIGAGIAIGISTLVQWKVNSDGTVKNPDQQAPGSVAGGYPPASLFCYGFACAQSAESACANYPGSDGSTNGQTFHQWFEWVDNGCHGMRKYDEGTTVIDIGDIGSPSHYVTCVGLGSGSPGLSAVGGVCPDSNFAPKVGAVVPLSDAVNALSPEARSQPVNPQIIADMANKMWMGAASAPGYSGVPFDATNPITSADVNSWREQHPSYYPTVGDFVRPQAAPSGGTSATPFSLPFDTSPQGSSDPATSAPTATNPASANPLTNLGPDPNIGMPTLESIPTVAQILDPVFSLFPSLRQYTVPQHTATCPTATLNLFNHTQAFDAHCNLLEQVRAIVAAVMAAVWVFVSLRVVLSA